MQTEPSLARLDPDGSWVRMYQEFTQATLDGSLEAYSLIWPRWGTLLDGRLTGLLTWERSTGATGCSLWHTPTTGDNHPAYEKCYPGGKKRPSPIPNLAAEVNEGMPYTERRKFWRTLDASVVTGGAANGLDRIAQGHSLGLHDQVNTPALWPTPRSGKTTDEDEETWTARQKDGKVSTPPLTLAVKMWPTPTSRDHKDTGDCENVPENGLLGRVVQPSKESGSLNPLWVEWLMGFPPGWTDLSASETP